MQTQTNTSANQNIGELNHDYRNALILGLIIGVFLLPTVRNLDLFGGSVFIYIALLLFFPLGALAGIWLGKLLFERFRPVWQFVKFGLIGVANTAINFGVLNSLAILSGINRGWPVYLFGATAFTAALVNSYSWNSHWSFGDSSEKTHSEFIEFFAVTFIGFLINNYILYFISSHVAHPGITQARWLNISNVIATLITMFWNFAGFKFLVFKKKKQV